MRAKTAWVLLGLLVAAGCGNDSTAGKDVFDDGLGNLHLPDSGLADIAPGTDPGRPDVGIDAPGPSGDALEDVERDPGEPNDAAGDPGDVEESPDAPPPQDTPMSDPGSESPCPRLPGPDDYVRKVVVSLPYDAGGSKSDRFAVLGLGADGTLSMTTTTFDLGRRHTGSIVFTPDGRIGIVATDAGRLGIFRFENDGAVTVIDAGFAGTFYASEVVMDPSGERVWVLNAQWRENGGGVYAVRLACDGTPVDEGLRVPGKMVSRLLFSREAPSRVLAGAVDVLDSEAGREAHLLSWGAQPTRTASVDAFGDDDAMLASAALTRDGRFLLLGDNQEFSNPELPNRVAVVEVLADRLEARQILTPVEDPIALLTSPYDDAVLAVSGYGNNVFVLRYDPQAQVPFANHGAPTWGTMGRPQLPGGADQVERGGLKGLVLMTEVRGIRMLRFEGDGTVTDLGLTSLGDGIEAMPGAIGVQP